MDEHTILVAITVEAPDPIRAQLLVQRFLPDPSEANYVDSWWIAEDNAIDENDCDSAIFVPRGAQGNMRDVLNAYFEAHEEEWVEDGYPYADTDVSGAWFPAGVIARSTCRYCQRYIVTKDGESWIDPEAMGDDKIWRETCGDHDTFTAEHEPEEN